MLDRQRPRRAPFGVRQVDVANGRVGVGRSGPPSSVQQCTYQRKKLAHCVQPHATSTLTRHAGEGIGVSWSRGSGSRQVPLSISHLEIARLPTLAFAGRVTVVSVPEDARGICISSDGPLRWRKCGFVGLHGFGSSARATCGEHHRGSVIHGRARGLRRHPGEHPGMATQSTGDPMCVCVLPDWMCASPGDPRMARAGHTGHGVRAARLAHPMPVVCVRAPIACVRGHESNPSRKSKACNDLYRLPSSPHLTPRSPSTRSSHAHGHAQSPLV